VATTLSRAKLLLESACAPIEPKQNEKPERNKAVGEDHQEVVGCVVAVLHRLVDVPVGGAEHEQRPAQARREPERAADPDAEKAEDAPSAVMDADLELKWTARRPADGPRRFVGEEDVWDEPEQETHDADVNHERIDEEDVEYAELRPRHLADIDVYERKQNAQDRNAMPIIGVLPGGTRLDDTRFDLARPSNARRLRRPGVRLLVRNFHGK
jgi:hypothetical protein